MTQFSPPFGWSSNKWLLILSNMFAGIILIILSHTTVLPLDGVNFIFFSFVGLLFALYRPGWTFLLLVGMLPYEIINIAPESYSLTLRPYQWLLVLMMLSLLIRFAFKRFPVEKFVPNKWDMSVIILSGSAFVSAVMSEHPSVALKLSVILLSFVLLYFVTRIFIRSVDDIRMSLPFILSSFLIIALYAIIQNIFFLNGSESFEVMAGRPNATFAEADWLGGYLAAILVVLGALVAFPKLFSSSKENTLRSFRFVFSFLLFFGFVALIITVSRSAWLAAFSGIVTVFFFLAWQNGVWRALVEKNGAILMDVFRTKLLILVPFLLAFLFISFSGLSPFNLSDRSRSTATGEQKITVSCDQNSGLPVLPEKIESMDQLSLLQCRHIMLEEIDAEVAAGRFISTVYRDDPNVHIRSDIYVKVRDILKERPIFGIGFGNISLLLGTDERGTGLNASNIFLEIWLGAGAMGFLAAVFFWFGLGLQWLYRSIKHRSPLAVLFLALWITLTVFNLFNTGLFLGFFFFCLALFSITHTHEDD